jgi:predicted phage terminase large subunit-like protein
VKAIGNLSWNDLLSLAQDLEDQGRTKDLNDLWYWRCATDLELFSVAYFPHYCQFEFNEFHRDTFSLVQFMERAVRRARAAPRGYAKSTLSALIKPIHDVCYGLETFIVIISNTQSQADGKLKDIRAEILENSALASDYGINFPRKNVGETQYVVHCGKHRCMFASFGAGVEIRGIRFGSERPSKIVVDDSEHSEEVLNEAIRQKYEDWYFKVVSHIGNEKTNIDFVGTVLHRESLLTKLLNNPAYSGKLYKAVINWSERQDLWDKWTQIYTNLDNPNRLAESELFYKQNEDNLLKGTKVLWPEKEPYVYLMKQMVEMGRRAFFNEKQNEPVGGDEQLFQTIRWYRETEEGLYIEHTGVTVPWANFKDQNGRWLNAYAVLDPATGQTKAKSNKKSDYACIPTGLKDGKGRLFVHRDWTKRASPTKQIEAIFEHHLEFDYQKFGVETNLYRNLLLPNIVKERQEREKATKKVIQLPFYDIENVDNKEKRIYTLEPKTTHGWILFNRALSQEFIGMLEAFPHGDHDDGPDALEMLWGLVNNRYKAASLSISPMGGR